MSTLEAFGIPKGKKKHYEEAVYCVTLINNVINKNLSPQLAPHKLTHGKFNVLMAVKHLGRKEGIKQVEISKNLILTPSNITKLVDKLEKEGLVTRSAPPGDRRVNLVTITVKGSKVAEMAAASTVNGFKKMTDNLGHDKLEKLSALLIEWFNLLQ